MIKWKCKAEKTELERPADRSHDNLCSEAIHIIPVPMSTEQRLDMSLDELIPRRFRWADAQEEEQQQQQDDGRPDEAWGRGSALVMMWWEEVQH